MILNHPAQGICGNGYRGLLFSHMLLLIIHDDYTHLLQLHQRDCEISRTS